MKFKKERLIAIRESLGINKAEAARRLNMSAMGYGRYENGDREPSFQTVSFIAETFETSIEYLYGLTDNPLRTSITISSQTDPDLFLLVNKIQDNNSLTKRLLTYLSSIS